MNNIDLELNKGDMDVQQLDSFALPGTVDKAKSSQEDPPEIIRIFRPLQSKTLIILNYHCFSRNCDQTRMNLSNHFELNLFQLYQL